MTRHDALIIWPPRLLAIGICAFLALFSLDVFAPGASPADIAIGLIMHNIPVFILAALIAVAWRREIIGAVTFAAGAMVYLGLVILGTDFHLYMLSWVAIISGPALLVAGLYWRSWKHRRQRSV